MNALDKIDAIRTFLKQRTDERSSMAETLEKLTALIAAGGRR